MEQTVALLTEPVVDSTLLLPLINASVDLKMAVLVGWSVYHFDPNIFTTTEFPLNLKHIFVATRG